MLAIVHSRASVGVAAPAVTVEVHLSGGLPALSIVGLPETGVREARERVRSALLNAGFEFPARRITINLAPADLPKEGGRFDLPIALGILAASGQLPGEALDRHEFVGELSLDGALRPLTGVLPAVLAARDAGRTLLVPQANAAEAALASRVGIENWLDPIRYHAAKIPFRIEMCPLASDSIAAVLAAMKGKSARALVLPNQGLSPQTLRAPSPLPPR